MLVPQQDSSSFWHCSSEDNRSSKTIDYNCEQIGSKNLKMKMKRRVLKKKEIKLDYKRKKNKILENYFI